MEKHVNKTYKKQRRTTYTVLSISLAALSLVALGGVYYFRQAETYKRELHNTYMQSFHEMADYLSDIDVGLKKTMLAEDPVQLSTLSAQIRMQAETAKACLERIPTENMSLDKTAKFLSQAGDYCAYLSRKVITDGAVTEEEYQNLSKLSAYAEKVDEEFAKMENDVYDQVMDVVSLKRRDGFYTVHADGSSFADGIQKMESMPQEYPSLVYDGPFSEHLNTEIPKTLKDEEKISRMTAEGVVRDFLGEERAMHTKYESDGEGTIETYLFSGQTDDRNISMEVTQYGGKVLWMLDAREVKEERLSVEQAMAAGETFLIRQGYPSMKSRYYDVSDNIATINYAYEQDGVTMYPDLIKVKVALDNGEVVGFESRGFLMCHREREIPVNVISEEEAREKAGTHLSVDSVSMAYIPLESKREVYCYELKGTLGKNNFLIYINAETGREEKILMLLESERGILTI